MLKVPEKIFNIDINDIEVGLSDYSYIWKRRNRRGTSRL